MLSKVARSGDVVHVELDRRTGSKLHTPYCLRLQLDRSDARELIVKLAEQELPRAEVRRLTAALESAAR